MLHLSGMFPGGGWEYLADFLLITERGGRRKPCAFCPVSGNTETARVGHIQDPGGLAVPVKHC